MLRASLIAFCAFVLMCTSCRHHGHRYVTMGFYHWKTAVNLTTEDHTMLKETSCKKMYVNFFDVVPNADGHFDYPAVPGSQTANLNALPHGMEIIPVIYITNEAMKAMDSSTIPLIADKIHHKVARFVTASGIDSIHELQIDCDWTNSTRDKYFYLLSQIKQHSHIPILSATIRLYQYKYFKKAGVPPVDRGTLMFYHMNSVRDIESKELILDVAEGKKYLDGEPYPLRLDYALPLFSEMLVGDERHGVKFYSPKTFAKLMEDTALSRIDSLPGRYKVVKDTHIGDEYLGTWDKVRMETVKLADLQQAADLLSARANSDTFSVIFFHLDRDANSSFTTHEVKDIIHRFD
ncbi:MAG: hypothetical protein JWO03_945 [Bacteroidetes bacterium]|nr:hypothetical protein [Bacteroidota bacterium]